MTKRSHKLLWVAKPGNRKTGTIPTAYVGETFEKARESCEGCALLGNNCYAWASMARGFGAVLGGYRRNPSNYTVERALERRHGKAKMVRLGALGDPGRAVRDDLVRDVALARRQGLAVVGYTHHWREERINSRLKRIVMASCNNDDEAVEALDRGWRPATLLPWDHQGNTFTLPNGARGVVCPAQTKSAVTCNDCRMCDPNHPVWDAEKVEAIGFKDHGPKVRRKIRERAETRVSSKRRGKALPLTG